MVDEEEEAGADEDYDPEDYDPANPGCGEKKRCRAEPGHVAARVQGAEKEMADDGTRSFSSFSVLDALVDAKAGAQINLDQPRPVVILKIFTCTSRQMDQIEKHLQQLFLFYPGLCRVNSSGGLLPVPRLESPGADEERERELSLSKRERERAVRGGGV